MKKVIKKGASPAKPTVDGQVTVRVKPEQETWLREQAAKRTAASEVGTTYNVSDVVRGLIFVAMKAEKETGR